MNQFEMIAIIVVAVMIASVFKSRFSHRRERVEEGTARDIAENQRLREEVKGLKERIHVLERIAVEKEDTLTRQIDELRDR